jgi:hypothetical protein
MKIIIYKDEEPTIRIPESAAVLFTFFKNKDVIKYEITPHELSSNKHILKFTFEDKDFNVGIEDLLAESILNEYRTELVDE